MGAGGGELGGTGGMGGGMRMGCGFGARRGRVSVLTFACPVLFSGFFLVSFLFFPWARCADWIPLSFVWNSNIPYFL